MLIPKYNNTLTKKKKGGGNCFFFVATCFNIPACIGQIKFCSGKKNF